MIEFDVCSDKYVSQLATAAKDDAFVREFHSLWTRWENWKKSPPIIMVDEGNVVGFLAYTQSKTGYLNVYYVWVAPDYRRKYIAEDLLDEVLATHTSKRLKLRCKNDMAGSAYKFWTGIGLIPVGRSDKEFAFDVDISGIEHMNDICDALYTVTNDKRTLNIYKKLGVVFTHPAWKHLNG